MTPIFLMGPTASGKSALAMSIAARVPCEIICVDSAQVYRGMDIGTAKPDAQMRALVPHHLLDIRDPAETYSVAMFCADAQRLIAEIAGRGKTPLLVGGTMLYFRALQEGFSELPPADAEVRARISAQAEKFGWPALHARLAQLDTETALRLNPNDGQRIQRALEIFELAGQPASRLQAEGRSGGLRDAPLKFALAPRERSELHRRIAARFMQMMEQGFLDEVRALRDCGSLNADLPSMRAVGYRQLWAHLDGEHDLPIAVERGIAATRQLAKRQLTWLRSEPGLNWLEGTEPDATGRVIRALEASVSPR